MNKKRLLVIGHGFLGDALMTLPFITRLAESGACELTVLARRPGLEAYRRLPGIACVIDRDEKNLLPRLRRAAFDGAFVLKDDFASALLAWRAGIPERTGFAREAAGLFLTRSRKPARTKTHGAARFFTLLDEQAPTDLHACFPVTPDEEARARTMLAGLPEPRIILAPSTTRPEKDWPSGHCRNLIARLARRGIATILVGGPGERARHATMYREPDITPAACLLDLTGQTSLGELAALLGQADLVVACDSGPMHLAAAVGAPLVALFGQTDPERSGPLDPGATVIRATTPCAPCLARHCGSTAACMDSIDPERVETEVLARLGRDMKKPD